MPAPLKIVNTQAPLCDVYGCGAPADLSTDGTEKDTHVEHLVLPVFVQADKSISSTSTGKPGEVEATVHATRTLGRPAIAKLNVCTRHANWPHSDDAKLFAKDQYPDPKVAVPIHLQHSARGAL